MLHSYNDNTWYTLYFIVFILFGVFFLLNVLLGVIFENYKKATLENQKERSRQRLKYTEILFDRCDEGLKGHLALREAKTFFSTILELDYGKEEDRLIFRRLMGLLDPERNKVVFKERILQFFDVAGFLHLDYLEEEQKKLNHHMDELGDYELSDADSWADLSNDTDEDNEDEYTMNASHVTGDFGSDSQRGHREAVKK